MSLLFHRRDIARAVVGDLPGAAEERLRAHLGRCSACRDFYDQLAHVAGGVATAGGGASRRAAEREGERLARALPGDVRAAAGGVESSPPLPQPRARRRWLLAGLALAPAVVVVMWLRHAAPPPRTTGATPEIALRGAPQVDTAASAPTLVVYASRRTGGGGHAPVRLAGEFPGSGTVRVSRSDYLQFGVRGLPNAAVMSIVAHGGDGGAPHVFLPREGAPPSLAPPGPRAATVGPSFDLARAPAAGRYTVRARFAPAATDAGMDGAMAEVSGLLIIEP